MKEYFKKKGVSLSRRTYIIDAQGAMAFGLFASLLVGTILNTLGSQFNIPLFSERIRPLVGQATGAAIAVAIASSLEAPKMVLYASTIVGLGAYEKGGPVGVYVAIIFAVVAGKLISGQTKLDIIITPSITIIVGILIGDFIGVYVSQFMTFLGKVIMSATELRPFLMGIVVSVLVGVALTLPISSAAICLMLGLSGLAGGAATAGCSAQMIGFAVISYRDNGFEGLLAQGLGTSMLQIPNTIKNPKIWIPPTLAAAITGPISTVVLKMENSPIGSGMGTCGLVGQISMVNEMGFSSGLLLQILIMHFLLPAGLAFVFYSIMRKKGQIKDGDMKLDLEGK